MLAAAEAAVLAVRAEGGRCGVAAALIGSRGAEMDVSSAAVARASAQVRQNEVSVEIQRGM